MKSSVSVSFGVSAFLSISMILSFKYPATYPFSLSSQTKAVRFSVSLNKIESKMSSIDKIKLIRQQAILLNHASTCSKQCTLPYCSVMKGVLNHLQHCQQMLKCPVARCTSSRQIIKHRQNCVLATCAICAPFRNKVAQNAHDDSMNQSFNLSQLNQSINLNDSSMNLGTSTTNSTTAFMSARNSSATESSSSDYSTTETSAAESSTEEASTMNGSTTGTSYAETTTKELTAFYCTAPSRMETNDMEMTAVEKSFLDKMYMVQSTPLRPVS